MHPISYFNTLLEQYVFRVAEAVIDQVDPDAQTQLIKFIYALDSDASVDNPLSNLTTEYLLSEILANVELSDQDVVDQKHRLTDKASTTGSGPDLCQRKLTYQQRLNRLDDLAHQLGQVQAKLASTQARLQEQIRLNKTMIARFTKYTLP